MVGRGLVGVLLVSGLLAVAGCGSTTTTSSSSSASASNGTASSVGHLPTAKFVLHAGLAFGAFHRYMYAPFKAGTFSGGLFKHKLAVVKAGLAGLFAYHELKLAVADARASPVLSKLLTPVNALAAKLAALGTSLRSGHIDTSALASASSDVTSLTGLAQQSGASIVDQIPGASQLSGG
jgi:hypothetical protein